jgi:hypothetical protein
MHNCRGQDCILQGWYHLAIRVGSKPHARAISSEVSVVKNRLYLVHRPTGQAVLLGKRGDVGWFTTDRDLGLLVNSFFGICERKLPVGGDQDDFVLAMECTPGSDAKPNCSIYEITAWKQDPEGDKTYPDVATLRRP